MVSLSTHNLSIGYSNKSTLNTIQSDLNLSLNAGELSCLIGPNGCGKSTLLRTLAGLQTPLGGEIKITDKNINSLSQRKKALLISMVLTERIEVENATVFDIVSLGRYPHTRWWEKSSEEDDAITLKAIEMVHLKEKKESLVNELSDGERQRVMIAKALVQDTPIIFLDEPTAHLDLPNRVEIMLLLQSLAQQTKKTILLSTHELDLALQAADRIWLMNLEKGIECGVPEDLIFNGSFNRTFKSKRFVFDKKNGRFLMNYNTEKSVSLKGEGERLFWTKRALSRIGYGTDENSRTKIIVKKEGWLFDDEFFDTMENLLEKLKNLQKKN